MKICARLSALAVCLLPLAACASTQICSLAGCLGSAKVTYSRAIAGPYSLTVSSGALGGNAIACPSNGSALADGGGDTVACDANGVTLSLGEVSDGVADASATLSLVLAISSAGNVLANDVTVAASLQGVDRPNGPACGPTCATYQGEVALAP